MQNIDLKNIDWKVILMTHKNKVLNVVIFLLMLYYANTIFKNQNTEIARLEQLKQDETAKNAAIDELARLEKNINKYKSYLARNDSAVYMNDFSDFARQAGIGLTSIKPMGEEKHLSYSKNTFLLSITANNYHMLGKFVNILEKAKKIYTVEEFTITPLQDTPLGKNYMLGVKLKVGVVTYAD